jgi:hypothetical protein
MEYKHRATGLVFTRKDGCRPVQVCGNTFAHRSALQAAGLAWNKTDEIWEGDVEDVASLDVPRNFEILPGLGVRTKSKVGGGTKIVGL